MKISKITLQDKEISLHNMVLIVGANGTGKTRLLDELHSVITGRNRSSSYWGDIGFTPDIHKKDLKTWINYLRERVEDRQVRYYCPYTKVKNNFDGRELQRQEYEKILDNDFQSVDNKKFLIKEFTHYLPIEDRLNVPTHTNRIQQKQIAVEPLNLLFRDKDTFNRIKKEIKKLFGKNLYLAPHNDPSLELHITNEDCPVIPTWNGKNPSKTSEEYQKWLRDNKIADLRLEGHGIKAFLNIMLYHSLPTNRILMIDEPEIHLHPSVKKKFGGTLGSLAIDNEKQFVCVTHDSDFIQGVLDSGCEITLIRLAEKTRIFTIDSVEYTKSKRPGLGESQSKYLQLPLLDCGFIVEGVMDCYVYEQVLKHSKYLENQDFKFISTEGKGHSVNAERIALDLKVPYVLIFDFDFFRKSEIQDIENINAVKTNQTLFQDIKALSEKLHGIPHIWENGIRAISDSVLKSETLDLLNRLKEKGVFVVPLGKLESWGKIKAYKSDFPDVFMRKYRWRKSLFPKLNVFINELRMYVS